MGGACQRWPRILTISHIARISLSRIVSNTENSLMKLSYRLDFWEYHHKKQFENNFVLVRQPRLILILLLYAPNYVSKIIFWLITWHFRPTNSLERWLYYSKYEILNHNGPGQGIYALLSYHINFEIALKYHIDLGNIHLNYRILYRNW